MSDFWGKLGNSIPKKGYSKYGKSLDKKMKVKHRKHTSKPAPKKARSPKEKPLKWRPDKIFKDRESAFRWARTLREKDGYETRVDGVARGYQVWIKS